MVFLRNMLHRNVKKGVGVPASVPLYRTLS